MKYLVNENVDLHFNTSSLEVSNIIDSVKNSHKILRDIRNFEVDIFSILGMRNLSAFVGEVFVCSLAKCIPQKLYKNPHQDGYPDLLDVSSSEALALFTENNNGNKSFFSPFKFGGIEVKATCGSVPKSTSIQPKLQIGEQRSSLLKGYDWKAHHRETNCLIGLLWDFDEQGCIQITSVFYQNKLLESDWGAIVKPKEGGGRTTSVSIMTREGVAKMVSNWILIQENQQLLDFLLKYNRKYIDFTTFKTTTVIEIPAV
jgi:hypothetical protein